MAELLAVESFSELSKRGQDGEEEGLDILNVRRLSNFLIVKSHPKKQRLSQEEKEIGVLSVKDDLSGICILEICCHSSSIEASVSPFREGQGNMLNNLNKQQLAVAERLARQLHEMEKKKQEEQKRKKTNEDNWMKTVRKKVDEQRSKLEEEEKHSHKANMELYKLFNDLQGIAKDLNISFEYPELVVVGMQSDGKSSFVEALLGFQFNVVETNIGTRRPLIIQMINNTSKEIPSCRFRKEYPIADQDPFEDRDTPVNELLDEITRRTNERAGVGSDKVSDIPIILRVEFKECANLTIYDTPGYRLGGDERLKSEITRMVSKLLEPKHRIIICLEQSTVEWANSSSRPIVRKIDPDFSRTILVNTKFDNRVKELRNKAAADNYLIGENLPSNVKPFFISLPVRRNLDSYRFKDSIRDSFLDDYEKLLEVNFDEKKHALQLGMFRVKSYLEKLLNEKYQQSLAPTLRALEDICKKTDTELTQINTQLQQHDIHQLRNSARNFVQSFVNQIENLLGGSIAGDPDKNGETLQDEKLNSGITEWPDFNIEFDIPNAKHKVYGGAQYARLLNEFEFVAHSREFPYTTASEIASALGASKSGYNAPETAAANLVQMKAKHVFLPLIDIVLQRCSFIMKRLFYIAIHVIKFDRDQKSVGILSVYEKFTSELQNTYDNCIDKIEQDCRIRLKDDFIMFTKMVDWDLLTSNTTETSYNYLEPTIEETKARVQEIMDRKPMNWFNGERTLRMDEEGYKRVALIAAKMYASIRYFFAKYVRNKLNAFFLDPVLQEVGANVVNHFYKLPEKKYEEMFLDGVAELREHSSKLEHQLQVVTQQRDRFKDMYYKMKNSTSSLYEQQQQHNNHSVI